MPAYPTIFKIMLDILPINLHASILTVRRQRALLVNSALGGSAHALADTPNQVLMVSDEGIHETIPVLTLGCVDDSGGGGEEGGKKEEGEVELHLRWWVWCDLV